MLAAMRIRLAPPGVSGRGPLGGQLGADGLDRRAGSPDAEGERPPAATLLDGPGRAGRLDAARQGRIAGWEQLPVRGRAQDLAVVGPDRAVVGAGGDGLGPDRASRHPLPDLPDQRPSSVPVVRIPHGLVAGDPERRTSTSWLTLWIMPIMRDVRRVRRVPLEGHSLDGDQSRGPRTQRSVGDGEDLESRDERPSSRTRSPPHPSWSPVTPRLQGRGDPRPPPDRRPRLDLHDDQRLGARRRTAPAPGPRPPAPPPASSRCTCGPATGRPSASPRC